MCELDQLFALKAKENDPSLTPSDMDACPCIQVAGHYEYHGRREFFSFWPEHSVMTDAWGIKPKHCETAESVSHKTGPDMDGLEKFAVYLTDDFEATFATPADVEAPETAHRVGWVALPTSKDGCEGILLDYLDKLKLWAHALCGSYAELVDWVNQSVDGYDASNETMYQLDRAAS